MFNKTELNEKLTAELREIAKTKGILNAEELRKAELVEIIAQIAEMESAPETPGDDPEPKAPKVKAVKGTAAKESTTEKPVRKRTRIPAKEEDSNTQRPFNRASLFDPQPASAENFNEGATAEEEEAQPDFEAAKEVTEVAEVAENTSAPAAPSAVPAFENKKNKPQPQR